MTSEHGPDDRARVELLEERQRLNDEADEAIELAIRDRMPLETTMSALLPLLATYTRASSILVHTVDEGLHRRDFVQGPRLDARVRDTLVAVVADRRPSTITRDEGSFVVHPIDVAGDDFGFAALSYDQPLDEDEARRVRVLVRTWSEQLDGYLAAIALSRRKHVVTMRLSEALKEPVLDVGIARALDVIRDEVSFDDLLLVFRHEDDVRGSSLKYKVIEAGVLTHDSQHPSNIEVDDFIRNEAPKLLSGESHDLLERFGITRFREEVMIQGVRDRRIIGRLVVTSKRGEFHAHDRELLERFADYLRQRIVDFNREWKQLSLSFPGDVVNRLLGEEDYVEKYLRPKVRDVAILFADISGFSRISEQVLREPSRIGSLIDTWGAKVVEIVWETGGVFDKMVGDCVIGLFGPPFYDTSPHDRVAAAIRAAIEIRAMTEALGDVPGLEKLKDVGMSVSTGVSFGPLFVGRFGPNDNFTGFSASMNNTARLQGQAARGEILVMQVAVDALEGDGAFSFGEPREAKVKNVADALRFRALLPG